MESSKDEFERQMLQMLVMDDYRVLRALTTDDHLIEVPEDFPPDLRAKLPGEEAARWLAQETQGGPTPLQYGAVNGMRIMRYLIWKNKTSLD